LVSHAAAFDLPEDYAAAIFDIYNEALSNVARHAGTSRVAIALTSLGGRRTGVAASL